MFDSFSNITRRRLTMTIPGRLGAAELYGTRVSPVLFSMLGANPQLGRLFVPGDERPERNRLVILSDRSWRAQYAGDPGVLGSSPTIDGRPYTVVGIMSPGFAFPDAETDFWIPLTSAPVPPPSEPSLITLFLERVDSARLGVAVRTALGATRQQILRQFAIDGVVLAAAGAAVGIPLAYWIVELTVLVAPPGIPRVDEIVVHVPVLMLAIVASTVFGAVLGLGSAWRSTRPAGIGVITGSQFGTSIRSGFGRIGPRTLVVAAEVALAVVLCVGAGLLVRSFVGLVNVKPGYDARDVMAFQIVWPAGHVSDPSRLYEEVLSRLDADPAIQAVAATDVLPIAGAGAFHMTIGGLLVAPGSEPMIMRIVSRQYFRAMGMRIIEGRTFSEAGRSEYPDFNQQTMVELLSASVARPRFNMFVLGAFAIVALALAILGVYGVLSHAVTQRTREIGIRLAIGATPSRVRAAVLRQSLTLTGMGAAIGLLAAESRVDPLVALRHD